MKPQEANLLPHALIANDGHPRCASCAPPSELGLGLDLTNAPKMVVDQMNPALCSCPLCRREALTPVPMALTLLAARFATKP